MNKPNFKPSTIFVSDNLRILKNMNAECVDLIYLDPPFNKKKKFTAPIGSSAQGAEFSDYFSMNDVEEEWVCELFLTNKELYYFLYGVRRSNQSEYNYAYLVYMAMRLVECRRVLKPTGSIYLHCDHTMSHYIKLTMDLIFGEKQFRNEIVWCYGSPGSPKKHFPRKHDTIFFYAKSDNNIFNADAVRIPHKRVDERTVQEGWRREKPLEYTKEKASELAKGKTPSSWWEKFAPAYKIRGQYTGYPTQKPLDLLKRIISASSNPGDLVLDPFCGCATTCVAAEILGRKWVGIDVSMKAWDLVRERMQKELPNEVLDGKYHSHTDLPKGGNLKEVKGGYIYIIARASQHGVYKVGITGDPKRRVENLKTSVSERDHEILFAVKTPHFKKCEKHIHKKFDDVREHEWLTADYNDIKASIEAFLKEARTGANAPPQSSAA